MSEKEKNTEEIENEKLEVAEETTKIEENKEQIKEEETSAKAKEELPKETEEKTPEETKETKAPEKKYNKYEENLAKKSDIKWAVALAILGVVILIAVLFSTMFALANMNNTTILDGVSVKGIDLKGLTKEEATAKVTEQLTKELEENIVLNYQEYTTTTNGVQIEANYNIDELIKKAYNIGRGGNIFQNNYEILKCLIDGINIEPELNYQDELLHNVISDIDTKIPGALKQYSYYIEDGNLVITAGETGIATQEERLKKQIIAAISSTTAEDNEMQIPTQIVEPNPIDMKQIHQEIYTEPKDAYYTTEPFTIYPHIDGVDFAISLDEAIELLQTPSTEYTVPLKYTTPEVTTNQIGTEAFPNLLSTFSTKYDITNKNRSNNLVLAAGKINGTILMPGEEFSYNKVVGERTIAAGYKEAKIYSAGKIVDGLGGGICQISSTLYNSALYANLEITSRRNHQFTTSYVKAGLDATVVYGSTDFKFVNSRKYPIKIVAEVKNGIAKMDIYGVKEEVEYEVKLEPVVLSYIPYKTQYVTDTTLEKGREVVKQKGSNGCKTVTYKYLLQNGNIVSKTEISRDTYNAVPKIVNVGA